MKVVFADTFYFLAALNPHDQYHDRTLQLAGQLRARYLTTDWILVEVADAMAGEGSRAKVATLIQRIRTSPVWEIVPASNMFFDRALQLYDQHRDKEWSFTDCTSFVVMKERGITEALTGDHHFEQAGFIALLK